MDNKKFLFSIVLTTLALMLLFGCTQSGYEQNTTQNTNQNADKPTGVGDNQVVATGGTTGEQTQQKSYNVVLQNFNFNPQTLTINVGDKVIWRNGDTAQHTVTSDTGSELDSPLMQIGSTYEHTFNQKGEFDYHCTPHPSMKGKIIVE